MSEKPSGERPEPVEPEPVSPPRGRASRLSPRVVAIGGGALAAALAGGAIVLLSGGGGDEPRATATGNPISRSHVSDSTTGPSGTLAATPGPDALNAELPPLVGEATLASIFNDSSLEGIDLGEPIAVAPDLDFPVYALTDEVRAAMGPGWSLWLASGYDANGDYVTPELMFSSPGGTAFEGVSLGGIVLDDEGIGEFVGVTNWFPPNEQAFVTVADVDASYDVLVDLRTGEKLVGPSSSEGWGGGSWHLVSTRDDGTQVWVEYYSGDGAPAEVWNLKGLELREVTGEWRPVNLDFEGLYHGVVGDPTGVYVLALDYGRTFVTEDEFSGLAFTETPGVAILDTVGGTRTDYRPEWPVAAERCWLESWVDAASFVAGCAIPGDGGIVYPSFRVFLDGSTPPVALPEGWVLPTFPYGAWPSSDGLAYVESPDVGYTEIDLVVDAGRIKVLDIARLAETPGLEAATSGATTFYAGWSDAVGGSLVFASGWGVGEQGFCLAVDTVALTYDVVATGPESEARDHKARRCGEWATAYYDWP